MIYNSNSIDRKKTFLFNYFNFIIILNSLSTTLIVPFILRSKSLVFRDKKNLVQISFNLFLHTVNIITMEIIINIITQLKKKKELSCEVKKHPLILRDYVHGVSELSRIILADLFKHPGISFSTK